MFSILMKGMNHCCLRKLFSSDLRSPWLIKRKIIRLSYQLPLILLSNLEPCADIFYYFFSQNHEFRAVRAAGELGGMVSRMCVSSIKRSMIVGAFRRQPNIWLQVLYNACFSVYPPFVHNHVSESILWCWSNYRLSNEEPINKLRCVSRAQRWWLSCS
jgi:hypothetical protein